MKKFTINCDFGGQMSPFTIFIGEPESEHHPLHFQADWLSKQRNGTIPSQVMDAIAKLKELADKNNVSLEELCVYALGSVGADESGAAASEGEGEVAGGQNEVASDASSEQVLSTETIPTQEAMDTVLMDASNNEALPAEEAADIVEVRSNDIVDAGAPAVDGVSVGIDNITVQESINPLPEEQAIVADNNILPERQNLVNTEQNQELVDTTNKQQEVKVDLEKNNN